MAKAAHKVCTNCGLDKPQSDYYCDKRATHGLCTQCKDCMNTKKKAKRNADPEARKAAWREDYRQNKERYTNAGNAYRSRNADRFSYWTRNNAGKRRAPGSTLSSREFSEWALAQEKKCAWCGIQCGDDFHVDHAVPIAKGGKHELGNLAIVCPKCNRLKRAKMPEEFAAEFGTG